MDSVKKRWHRYHYKNLTYTAAGIILSIALLAIPGFRELLAHLGSFGYLGAFLGGMLFVSTFTVSIGTAILILLAQSLNPVEIGIFAGMGAVIGDLTIFSFIRSRGLASEIMHFFQYWGGDDIRKLVHTKYFSWTLPVLGALIIASPLPDELGIGLMGISRLNTLEFIALSFLLNTLGIITIILAALAVRI